MIVIIEAVGVITGSRWHLRGPENVRQQWWRYGDDKQGIKTQAGKREVHRAAV